MDFFWGKRKKEWKLWFGFQNDTENELYEEKAAGFDLELHIKSKNELHLSAQLEPFPVW